MAKRVYRYSVWVSVETDEEGDAVAGVMDKVHDAMAFIPGFMESSFEDSYEDYD